MSKSRRWCDWDLVIAVAESHSIAEVCRQLGIKAIGGNYRTVRTHIQRLQLDISHFRGMGWRRGNQLPVTPPRPLSEILVEGSHYSSARLRKRLLAEGLFRHQCSICRRDEWNGLPISLELDHVNGRPDDNRLSNLRLLCPNCHAQTETYRGRNIGRLANAAP